MYTIQFGSRAGFIDAASADAVFRAIRENERFVTLAIDMANDGGEPHEVTLNTAHIVALIKHRPAQAERNVANVEEPAAVRTRLTVVS